MYVENIRNMYTSLCFKSSIFSANLTIWLWLKLIRDFSMTSERLITSIVFGFQNTVVKVIVSTVFVKEYRVTYHSRDNLADLLVVYIRCIVSREVGSWHKYTLDELDMNKSNTLCPHLSVRFRVRGSIHMLFSNASYWLVSFPVSLIA